MFDKKAYMKEYSKQWRIDNIEHTKQYYKDNKERIDKQNKQWNKDNPEDIKKTQKKYFKTDKGKTSRQRSNAKRQARLREIVNTLTSEEWIDILKKYKFKCAYCGKEFTLFDRETHEHVIPISKGGNNVKENVVPACQSCNSKKYNKIL